MGRRTGEPRALSACRGQGRARGDRRRHHLLPHLRTRTRRRRADADETVWLAKEVEKAGADCISTGIGWHEAAVPTIAGPVPHGAFIESTRRLKGAVLIPVT